MAGRGVDLSGGGGVDLSGGGAPQYTQAGAASGGFGGSVAQAALNNPTVQANLQAAAYEQANTGLAAAKEAGKTAAQELGKYIREGPAGISVLCFLGGIVTFLVGFFGLFSIASGITSPFSYVLNIYLTGFGFVSVILEADVQALGRMAVIGKAAPLIISYQNEIDKRANFLTKLFGRGLFYFFVGSLAITQCFVCLLFLVGLWNVLMGAICLLMSFGINPVEQAGLQSMHGGEQTAPLANNNV